MKIFITGGSGQLAKAFMNHCEENGIDYCTLNIQECDITDNAQLQARVKKFCPDVLINCAAYNLVEQAEDDHQRADQVNSDAVGAIAQICKERDILFVHYSTDYVFDGTKGESYTESDQVNPKNAYGKSKLKGEQKIAEVQGQYLIFRTSWVFGDGTSNFFYKLSQWSQNTDTLNIVTDEESVPTFTEDIVYITVLAIENNLRGLYHLTNTGHCSRFDMAKKYFDVLGDAMTIQPGKLADFVSKVDRPHFSAMSNKRISDKLNIRISTWEEAVEAYIKKYVR